MLNAGYFLPMQLVGFLMWRKHMESEGPVHVRMQTSLQFIVCACLAMVLTMAYGKFLATLPGQNSPFLDAGSTVLSVIAMILMAMRYGDQWVYWIIINFVSITMWSLRFNSGVEGAAPMVVMWSAYLVNAVYGGLTWKRIYEEQKHDWSIPR